jgi:PII-like signaling protein
LSITEWLLKEARAIGINGATIAAAQGGYGRDGKYYSTHFFELGEQPVEVTMAVDSEQANLLFSRIREETLRIFYIKIPIEFGITGDDPDD